MKTTGIILLMLAMSVRLDAGGNGPLAFGTVGTDGSETWKVIRNEQQIKIYERWLPVDAQREARELKARFYTNASPQTVFSILRNDELTAKWMHSAKDYRTIRQVNSENWYSYTVFNIPWPFNKQDVVVKNKLIRFAGSSKIIIKMESKPKYIAPVKDIVRIQHYEGSWIISPLQDGRTRVEYFVFSKQKPAFPRWITDPIIQNTLFHSMDDLRSLADKYAAEKSLSVK